MRCLLQLWAMYLLDQIIDPESIPSVLLVERLNHLPSKREVLGSNLALIMSAEFDRSSPSGPQLPEFGTATFSTAFCAQMCIVRLLDQLISFQHSTYVACDYTNGEQESSQFSTHLKCGELCDSVLLRAEVAGPMLFFLQRVCEKE